MQKPRVAVFVIAALLVTEFAVAEDKPFPPSRPARKWARKSPSK
jgi:hypothetical protein